MVKHSKILVAGGSGFIGANLIKELIHQGNEVISISKNPKKTDRKIEGVVYIFNDLKRTINNKYLKIFSDVDYIINCSGYIDHKQYSNGGKKIFDDHFETVYVLSNLAIELKVKAFIHIGTSDEYGKGKSPLKESSRESPISPYALGKLTATHYLQQCYAQGYLNSIILRPFLVFGEMQSPDRFLPYLIKNCINDKEFKVSKGEQIRDYLYIKDFNRALIKSLNNKDAYGEVINIASGIPISIKEVINNVIKITGKGKPIWGGIDYREGESMQLYASIKKAKKILNWEPEFEFENSLKKVINWYLKND